jgi:hypothetical protein
MLPAGMHAVELPPLTVELELGRRRHRRITGPSGLLLFLCAFLPFLPDFGGPPAELPVLLPPYLYGLLFALAAAAHTARGMRRAIDAMRVLTVILLSVSAILAFILLPLGILAAAPGALVFATLGWTGRTERRAALCAIVVGALCTLWFGLFVSSPDVMPGIYLSLVGSVGLLVGGLVWLAEATRGSPLALPDAIARPRS